MVFKSKTYEKQRSRTKRVIDLYSKMLLNGNVDFVKLQRVYNRAYNPSYAEFNIKKIIRNNADMVTEALNRIYEESGITTKTVIEEEKKILEQAKEANNLRIQLDVVNNWRDSLDMKPKQTTVEAKQTNYLKYIDKTGSIEAKQTKQIESGEK